MSNEWYYSKGSVESGPVSEHALRDLVKAGTLTASDMVWRQGMDGWAKAASLPELASEFPTTAGRTGPPPLVQAATTSASGSGTKILVLTIIAAFFSVFIGGCTSALGEQIGADGADSHAGFGLLQALLGVGGGVWAFRKYNDPSVASVGGRRFRRLTLAAVLILAAAVLSISNALAFITAGVLNAVAGALALMKAKSFAPE